MQIFIPWLHLVVLFAVILFVLHRWSFEGDIHGEWSQKGIHEVGRESIAGFLCRAIINSKPFNKRPKISNII